MKSQSSLAVKNLPSVASVGCRVSGAVGLQNSHYSDATVNHFSTQRRIALLVCDQSESVDSGEHWQLGWSATVCTVQCSLFIVDGVDCRVESSAFTE